MPRVRNRNAYQHVSDFDKSRIVAYRDCGLSYLSTLAQFGRDPMTIVQPGKSLEIRIGVVCKTFARTVRRRLQQYGLSARRPWLRLPLTQHHKKKHLQWWDQQRLWTHECRDVIFSDEYRFCLQHQDSHNRVWRHRGERTLVACVNNYALSLTSIKKIVKLTSIHIGQRRCDSFQFLEEF
ncbi:transposable element Tc1 transposase [Trichonephila clavipes]|uniref:Transposable element Tc1 transposase n=1 Tax=Trichonephila clavipes TaxID=2585209 RepID=A0A8X6RYW7_TRICX|nr:transposable element Tc1 transposase [Trichonephila clavipes]